ncbi:MAG TPA: primosomal protein N' [Firmicutes bacterium]|nr:primosomal protein N' [Bacillota bacterium]
MYARVAVTISGLEPLLYIVPDELQYLAQPGRAVTVPVGGRSVRGVILEVMDGLPAEAAALRLRPLLSAEEVLLSGDLLELGRYIETRYCSTIGRALCAMLPPAVSRARKAKPTGAGQAVTSKVVDGIVPTSAQRECAERIVSRIEAGEHGVFLLFGPTGSGKTEVYMRCIERCLSLGKSAIMLVPEISLTPQTVGKLESRFPGRVICYHSALSDGERARAWLRARDDRVSVVVGARSALFLPARNLGVLIIDEEHDWAFKQEEDPRYHAREVAIERARELGIPVVLGSATPSMESFYRGRRSQYELLVLPKRVNRAGMPEIGIVDKKCYEKSPLSPQLEEAMREALSSKEQVLLLLNRRGYYTFVVCQECGWTARCPSCDVSLVVHKECASRARMLCHYCGWEVPVPVTCPRCGGHRVRFYGTGTQRLEAELAARFPGARICRIDRDTTRRKGVHQQIYDGAVNREIDVLVGTQMIAKGLDIPGITLVGILNADAALSIPDFRAAERTFQLIVQTAGRSGRRDKPGRVFVEAFDPQHYAIEMAAKYDYVGFYMKEMQVRLEHRFPPFSELATVLVSGQNEAETLKAARHIATGLRLAGGGALEILGPAPALHARLKNRFRWRILAKSIDANLLGQALRAIQRERLPARIGVAIDVDPYTIT